MLYFLFCFLDNKKKDGASPLWISDELEFWPDSMGKFTQITTLHSELIALSNTGQIYQWRWNDPEPYKHPEVCHLFLFYIHNIICICNIYIYIIYILTESKHSSPENHTIGFNQRESCTYFCLFHTLLSVYGVWQSGDLVG